MWRSGATGPRWYRYKGIKRQVRIDANGRLVAESSVPDDPALISPPESKPGTAHGKPALIDRQNPVLASGPICPRRPPKNGAPRRDRRFESTSLQRRVERTSVRIQP